MKFAIACLIGATTAASIKKDTTAVWELQSVQEHRLDSNLQDDYGTHSTNQANARPPLRSHLMTMAEALENIHKKHKISKKARKEGDDDDDSDDDDDLAQIRDDDEVDHSNEFFHAHEHEMLGDGGYNRVTTARFAADQDDIFMRSMIEQYALEGKNKDGSPNGQFWLDEALARSASNEVLETNCKVTGKAREGYLKTYFPRTWAHFDVNRTGKVEAIKMPQFMRFLCSDQQMYLW
jgi:ABC-type Zn2+ transport system substrate-binding protein/surface adhesin